MYDMYPWDSDSQGDYPPEPLRSRKAQAPATTAPARNVPAANAPARNAPAATAPARAVQVALDRRDNGGDAVAHPATVPAPGRARQ